MKSSRERARFVSNCQTDDHMDRDRSYRLSRGMESLDKPRDVLPLGRRVLTEAVVGGPTLLGIESRPPASGRNHWQGKGLRICLGSFFLLFVGNQSFWLDVVPYFGGAVAQ